MAEQTQTFTLPLPVGDALLVCRDVAAKGRWEVKTVEANGLTGRIPPSSTGVLDGEPWIQFRIMLRAVDVALVQAVFTGSCFGLGPYVNGKIKSAMLTAINAIEVAAEMKRQSASSSRDGFSDALQDLARLHSQGYLTDDEFQRAKVRVLG